MSNTVYDKCPACAANAHHECVSKIGTDGNEFCECTHKTTGIFPLSAKDWSNIKAQLQFVFLNIEDANDSDLEISSSLVRHEDNIMTFTVYRWMGHERKFVANIEMKLDYSDKKGLVIY